MPATTATAIVGVRVGETFATDCHNGLDDARFDWARAVQANSREFEDLIYLSHIADEYVRE